MRVTMGNLQRVTMGNLQCVIPWAICNMCYHGQPATHDTMHAGKIISKIAPEQAKAHVRVAARALRLRVQPQCKAICMRHRAARKKNVAGCSTIDHCIIKLWKQWRPLKTRTFPCFSGWIAAPARARGRLLRLLRTR